MGIKMLKKFAKYVSQNMLGMVGMSVYILADTYFISVAVGTDGITALNLVLPVYNLIFAVGAMMGVGSAIRLVIERNQKNPEQRERVRKVDDLARYVVACGGIHRQLGGRRTGWIHQCISTVGAVRIARSPRAWKRRSLEYRKVV